jgi:4-methyl-5(b-hydroxyethyl)-thiazole monophosphate biosynthesis
MEAVITIDVLRRAGADVAVASVEPGAATVAASWGVKLAADALLADLAEDEFDLISLPVSLLFCFPCTSCSNSYVVFFAKWNRIGISCAAMG